MAYLSSVLRTCLAAPEQRSTRWYCCTVPVTNIQTPATPTGKSVKRTQARTGDQVPQQKKVRLQIRPVGESGTT